MKAMKIFTSIDSNETSPITYDQLLSMAFHPATPDEYAAYLTGVLVKARQIASTLHFNIISMEFGIHQSGFVVPFGEGHAGFAI